MLELQVDFSLLNRFFGISPAKIPQYANKDIEEIMELEAAQGNNKARDYKKILSDPDKLLEIFKLANVENKLAILQNMSEEDLDKLLPYLEHEQLLVGLNFFTEEKLITMAEQLPIEALTDMIMTKFTIVDVLQFMNEESMDKFIQQPDVERKYSQNYFEALPKQMLSQILTRATGEDFSEKSHEETLAYLEGLEDNKYQRLLCSLERNDKINLIAGIVDQEPKLAYLFENKDMVMPMTMLMKDDKVKLMGALDDEFLIPMIQELPIDLTQIVLTQIDPRDFSEVLARDFQDILSEVVLFSSKMG